MSEIANLRLQIDALGDLGQGIFQRPVFCLYCDKSFPGDAVGQDLMRRHVAVCPAHPLGRLVAAAEELLKVVRPELAHVQPAQELLAAIAAAKYPAPIERNVKKSTTSLHSRRRRQ